jgi:hypothetical protein
MGDITPTDNCFRAADTSCNSKVAFSVTDSLVLSRAPFGESALCGFWSSPGRSFRPCSSPLRVIRIRNLEKQLSYSFAAEVMQPRLISKEHAKVVADAGGVIGVWTHLADSLSDFVGSSKAMIRDSV